MTRLLHFGADTGHIHAEGVTFWSGATAISTTSPRSGTRSFQYTASAANAAAVDRFPITTVSGRTYWLTFWVYFPSGTGLPSAQSRLVALTNAAASVNLLGIELTTSAKARLYRGAGTQIGSDSAASLTTDTWHRLDLSWNIATAGNDTAEAWLDGVSIASTSGSSLWTEVAGVVFYGHAGDATTGVNGFGANKVLRIDDIILQDDQGSVNNTRPANDEKVVVLVPVTLALNDSWTNGAGGFTGFPDAVDNIPPVGVANGSSTAASQIKNATSGGAQDITFNMTTYTAAGIGASDVVTAIYAVAEGANSSTTGTDTLGVSVDSNPAITEVVSSIDIVAATYPTGWNRCTTAIVEDPSVTLGTAPVAHLNKVISTTRVAQCCFLGMYVSYYEAGAPPAAAELGPRILSGGL